MYIGKQGMIPRNRIKSGDNFVMKAAVNLGLASLDMKISSGITLRLRGDYGVLWLTYGGNELPSEFCLDECC